RSHTFAVHFVVAEKMPPAKFSLGRIVGDIEELRQHASADAAFELARLECSASAAAIAGRTTCQRQALPEDLGEKLWSSLAFEQHRAVVILALWRLGQGNHVGC